MTCRPGKVSSFFSFPADRPPSHELTSHFLCSYFYPPTLIVGTGSVPATSLRIWREEAFGPVLVLVPFDTEEEAIKLANDSEYGLGSAIWTRDGAQAIRVSNKLAHGLVWVRASFPFSAFLHLLSLEAFSSNLLT